MAGWKEWQIGEVVEAADFQSYVQDQVVQVYADSAARGSALGTAVTEGMVAYLADTNSTEVYDGSSWIAVGAGDITSVTAGTGLTGGGTSGSVTLNVNQAALYTDGTAGYTVLSNGTAGLTYQPVSPNYIINGAFDIWQRGTSSTSFGYLVDRFAFNTAGGQVATQSQQIFTPAELNAIGFGDANFYYRLAITTASSYQQFDTKLENVRTLAGQTVTLSYWAKAATAGNFVSSLYFDQNFGSGGSSIVNTTITGSHPALTTSWTRYSFTFTIPSISGKTIGSNSYIGLRWLINGTGTLDLWGVQLEAGSVATPFKRNAPSLQGELAACQRYYFRATPSGNFGTLTSFGSAASTTSVNVAVVLPVEMRVAPTSVDFSTLQVYDAPGAGAGVTAVALSGNGMARNIANIDVTATGLTANRPYAVRANNSTSAFIGFSAEL